MVHGVDQAGLGAVRGRAIRGARSFGGMVADAPRDLDAQLAKVRVLPRWIGILAALATAAGLWTLIILGIRQLIG